MAKLLRSLEAICRDYVSKTEVVTKLVAENTLAAHTFGSLTLYFNIITVALSPRALFRSIFFLLLFFPSPVYFHYDERDEIYI